MSLNFGTSTPKTAASGFTLPTNPTTATAPATGSFQFGTGAGDTTNKAQNKPATTLFGSPSVNPASSAPINFGFGTPKSAAPVLTFPSVSTTSTTAPALPFGATATGTTAPSLSFGTPTTSASSPSLNFSAAPVSSNVTSLITTSATTAPTLASSQPQFGFGSKPTSATSTSFTPILGGTTGTTTSSGTLLNSSITPSTSSTPALSFGLPSTAASSTTLTLGSATAVSQSSSSSLLPATSSTSLTSLLQSSTSLTFSQLEDTINKWTIDLEEQGKFFINQAKQLNAWDSLLISNGEKILNLNASIERVKQQQQQLDQELDFIVAQQKELEELIRPLEKELVDLPVTDIDRNQMYQFSEIIDSQLKQMSDDLKEIIEHINETNKNEEVSNPVTQISRILNAHMNSLQWIDRNTAQISSQLEQITKMQDSNRRNFALNQSFNHSFNM